MSFPATRYSVVRGASSADAAQRTLAWDRLAAAYWQPVLKYVTHKWRMDAAEAQDATQGFFAAAIEKNYFAGYDPSKAKFRTFLRTCLDGYVANERKAAGRLKRGGGTESVEADDTLPADKTLDDYFRDEWVRALFGAAVDELHELAASRGRAFQIFERYDLESDPDISYQQLAAEFAMPVTQVTNQLAWARREFRRIVLERLREMTVSDEEFQDEARLLLGVGQ